MCELITSGLFDRLHNRVWSTDFPHHGCDWPYSRTVVGEMMVGVPQEERQQMLAGHMVRIHDLPAALRRGIGTS